ncbi:hypothetical protein VPHK406_0270 [Vibrio phage K406]
MSSGKFYSYDRSDEVYYEAMAQAYVWYREGKLPTYSTGICGSLTAGYGRLDELGYWEYPLNVKEDDWGSYIKEEK